MNGLSLFSGCLGLDLGLEAAGFNAVAYVEKDKHCQRVIEARRPGVPVIPDVRFVDEQLGLGDLEWLAGGFPCQDLSYAGKGAGLDGARSGLWFDMADAIRLLRPRLVLVENVPALATRGLGRVLYDLAEAGYVGSWRSLRAADVGAPHGRERIFILARLADSDEPGLEGSQSAGRRLVSAGRGGSASADAGRERLDGRGEGDARGAAGEAHGRGVAEGSAEAAPDAGGDGLVRVASVDGAHGGVEVEPRHDAHGCNLGDAGSHDGHDREAPTDAGGEPGQSGRGRRAPGGAGSWAGQEERDGSRLVRPAEPGAPVEAAPDADGGGSQVDAERQRRRARLGEGSEARGDDADGCGVGIEWGAYEPAVRRWEAIFGRAAPRPTDDRGRLDPRFPEWMLGFPAGWVEVDGVSRTAQLRMLGNAVQVQVAYVMAGLLLEEAA